MRLHADVLSLSEDCVTIRQDLHRIPDTGFEEREASEYIKRELKKFSPDKIEHVAFTGVKAVFYARGNSKETIAFRADMDGLNVQELTGTPYKSLRTDKMHACGHDGHMTILLLLAKLIDKNRDKLKVNVVLLFQPAEEGMGGASRMIDEGALKNPRVDRIYGMHVWPDVPKGKIGVRWGPMMAMTCAFDIRVRGLSSHGASPQMGVDAVVSAAVFISLMQTAITRNIDPHQGAVLTIGKINGGVARSIIADKVEMNATLRVFSEDVYSRLMKRIQGMADGLALATDAHIVINELMRHPCVDNPRELVEDFYQYIDAEDRLIADQVMISEDFSCYQREIPGLFLFLGVGGGKNLAPLHNPKFDFDEDALLFGVEAYRRMLFGRD